MCSVKAIAVSRQTFLVTIILYTRLIQYVTLNINRLMKHVMRFNNFRLLPTIFKERIRYKKNMMIFKHLVELFRDRFS